MAGFPLRLLAGFNRVRLQEPIPPAAKPGNVPPRRRADGRLPADALGGWRKAVAAPGEDRHGSGELVEGLAKSDALRSIENLVEDFVAAHGRQGVEEDGGGRRWGAAP